MYTPLVGYGTLWEVHYLCGQVAGMDGAHLAVCRLEAVLVVPTLVTVGLCGVLLLLFSWRCLLAVLWAGALVAWGLIGTLLSGKLSSL